MPAPLFIVHVDSAKEWRGGQQALLMLARGLAERGHRQTIVCPARSVLAERASAARLELGSGGALELRRFLMEADLVHAHTGHAQNALYLASLLGGSAKRVVTRHTAFEPRHPRIHAIKYARAAHGIIAVSEAVRAVMVRAGVPDEKIEVIHTGVELPAALPTASQRQIARAAFRLQPEDAAIGHLGAFTPEKGQDVAVRAAALLQARLPRLRMILAGAGPRLEETRALAAGAPVLFPGFVEDRETFYAALDLFVMPSRSEAWGLAALEAMAHGVPVVASDIEGLAEIVAPGEGAWLVPPNDPPALAGAIEQALSDPVLLRSAAKAARLRAEKFSHVHTVDQTEAFYRRLLAS